MKSFFLSSTVLLLHLTLCAQDTIPRPTASVVLEGSELRAVIRNDGSFFHADGEFGQFTGPRNEAGRTPPLLNYAGLWVSGFSEGYYRPSAVSVLYPELTDYAPGPLYLSIDRIAPDKQEVFNQIWTVDREEVFAHLADWLYDDKIDTIRPSVYYWPGYGNKHFSELFTETSDHEIDERYLVKAPFADLNENGLYEPHRGEYPALKREPYEAGWDIPGQFAYTVFNTQTDGEVTPCSGMHLELHQTAYILDCPASLDSRRTLFVDYEIINKFIFQVDEFRFGFFVDPHLGCPDDDFVGINEGKKMVYFYDGDVPKDCSVLSDFPINSPVVSLQYMWGSEPSNFMVMYKNEYAPPNMHYPQTCVEYNNYLNGRWRDGAFLTYGNTGYGGTEVTDFIYSGNPLTNEGWTLSNELHPFPYDEIFVMSSGARSYIESDTTYIPPFKMGESIKAEFAFSWFQTEERDNLEEAFLNADTVDLVHEFYLDLHTPRIELEPDCLRGQPTRGVRVPETLSAVISPNPVSDFLTIEILRRDIKSLEIYDLNGRLMPYVNIGNGLLNARIATDNYPAGMYILRIKMTTGDILTAKFIKI